MSSPGSIRLFTALLLGVVLWHWWHHPSAPLPSSPSAAPIEAAPLKEKSLFPDE